MLADVGNDRDEWSASALFDKNWGRKMKLGYMGTKRFLAPHVFRVINECRGGPVLDAFSGMGAVGELLADSRPLWVNDIQVFAAQVGRARFKARFGPPTRKHVEDRITDAFLEHRRRLIGTFKSPLSREQEAFASGKMNDIRRLSEIVHSRSVQRRSSTHDLFARLYGGTYFSFSQCIEIDSIRFAIDQYCSRVGQEDSRRWMLIALGIAMLRVATSTGHFAQYLEPKNTNLHFFLRQRRRTVFDTFLGELEALEPVGSREWRETNRVFNSEALDLMRRMYLFGPRPSVVYADPPYTKDQYSRYYHLWETLVLYDYPRITGKGRYREGRFQTEFAIKSRVVAAMNALAQLAAMMRADLVLSYPKAGLLSRAERNVRDVLHAHFKHVESRLKLNHTHSTMGASKGNVANNVVEIIYLARN